MIEVITKIEVIQEVLENEIEQIKLNIENDERTQSVTDWLKEELLIGDGRKESVEVKFELLDESEK